MLGIVSFFAVDARREIPWCRVSTRVNGSSRGACKDV